MHNARCTACGWQLCGCILEGQSSLYSGNFSIQCLQWIQMNMCVKIVRACGLVSAQGLDVIRACLCPLLQMVAAWQWRHTIPNFLPDQAFHFFLN